MAQEGRRTLELRIDHVGLWVRDLERMREFYARCLQGRCGPLYHNPRTGFRSYFVAFADGPRLELMHDGTGGAARPGRPSAPAPPAATARDGSTGYAHLALAVGSRAAVDALVAELSGAGVLVVSGPRTTGDGYYEAVVLDPEGNRIEITAG